MRKQTNTLSPSPKGFQSPKFSDSALREVRGLGRPKSSVKFRPWSTVFIIELVVFVLFICKTKSRLWRRHCGLARHFKTDPTETVALCFGYAKTLFWRRRHFGLARHFKTDPTKTVALCFWYAKTLCWRADGKADEQDNCLNMAVPHTSGVLFLTYSSIH
jgi:hypothetical protein